MMNGTVFASCNLHCQTNVLTIGRECPLENKDRESQMNAMVRQWHCCMRLCMQTQGGRGGREEDEGPLCFLCMGGHLCVLWGHTGVSGDRCVGRRRCVGKHTHVCGNTHVCGETHVCVCVWNYEASCNHVTENITNVMNGESHDVIEAAIYRVVDKRLALQQKRENLLHKKSAAGTADV